MAIQYPAVQTKATQLASLQLTKLAGFPVTVNGVYIDWFDVVQFNNVVINDTTGKKMIDIIRLEVDFKLQSIWKNNGIYLDEILIAEPEVHLVQDKLLNINQFIANIRKLSTPKKTKKKKGKAVKFHIDGIDLVGGRFTYNSLKADSLGSNQFDPSHIDFGQLHAHITKFRLAADTIELKIEELKGYENNSGLRIKKINAFFRYTKRNMVFNNLYAAWGESVVRDSLVFKYKNVDAFSNFINKVKIYANLKESIITAKDLAYFAPSLNAFKDTISITADFKGTVSNFRLKNMAFSFGEKSKFKGKLSFTGLPNITETLMDFDLKKSEIHASDVKQYIPKVHYQAMRKFGDISFDAEFIGFITDFATKGDFYTDLGYLKTDVNLKVATNYYKGTLRTKNFNIGKLVGNNLIGLLDIKGNIEGTGLSLENADFHLNAHLNRLGLDGYDYINIDTDGNFKQRLFKGSLEVTDPNIHLAIKGEVNLQDSAFNFVSQIDSANFKNLGLSSDTIIISSQITADFEGLDPNKINGELELLKNQITYKSKSLHLDRFDIQTFRDKKNKRDVKLLSDFFDLSVNGDFDFTRVASDFPRLMKEYMLSIQQNDSLWAIYYTPQHIEKVKKQSNPYDLIFNVNVGDLDGILGLFMNAPPHLSKGSKIVGEVSVAESSSFFITTQIDTISIGGNKFINNNFALSTDKHYNKNDFAAEFMLSSKKQLLGGLETAKFSLHGFRHEHSFIIDSKFNHPESGDFINFKGNLDVYPEHYEINLTNTNFRFLDKVWQNAGLNKIVLDTTGITIKDLSFASEKQRISINGNITENPSKNLNIAIENFDIDVLKTYTGYDLSGKLNVNANLKNIYNDMKVTGEINLDTLHVNEYLIGTLKGKTDWENDIQKLNISTTLSRNSKEVISLSGGFFPNKPADKQLDLALILEGASLEIFQPFVEDNISNLGGTAIGYISIGGGGAAPKIRGDLLILDGIFTVDYLNTTYTLQDKVYFKKGFIGFKKLHLIDQNHQKAILTGGIRHNKFKEMKVDLLATMNNFQAFNIEPSDDAIYYGEAYGTGSVKIDGAFSDLNIDVNVKSEKNTKIYIPLEGSENVVEQDYISFVSKNMLQDTLKIEEEEEQTKVDLSGMTLNFNLDITPDAYMEIIFDKKAGDIIKGNGKGKLKMEIDTKGDFNMYGDIEITKGQYNFTMLNVIDKKFTVMPNSHITWTGDPYAAQMDIIAGYTQRASLVPIIDADSSVLSQPEIKRRYPIKVLLGLKGELMSPAISFGIEITDYPSTVVANGVPVSLESYVAAFKQRLKNDEQELSRQAFSLIVLHKLSPEKTFALAGSAGSSVSELLTNQLSYWVSQVDENLEIDVDLNGLDKDALNSFQLRLSYTFLDGRLRVTRDGSFNNVANQSSAASIFGDWQVEYLLAPDGRLKLKMYHKQNTTNSALTTQNNTSTGLSFLHTKSFDKLGDFFVSRKKQAKIDERRNLKAHKKDQKKHEKKEKKTDTNKSK